MGSPELQRRGFELGNLLYEDVIEGRGVAAGIEITELQEMISDLKVTEPDYETRLVLSGMDAAVFYRSGALAEAIREKSSELGLPANSALPTSDEKNRRFVSFFNKEIK